METNTKTLTSLKPSLAQRLVLGLFQKMEKGNLSVTLLNNEKMIFGNTNEIKANIKIKSNEFFNKCLYNGDIGFGEAYVD